MKRLIILASILVVVTLLLALIFIPMKVNDIDLKKYTDEVMSTITVPEKTTIVEYVSGCGNSTGAGDHTDLYVAVLLKSELGWEELAESFGRVHIVEDRGSKTLAMDIIDLEFDENIGNGEGYYIVEFRKQGILDWRGW